MASIGKLKDRARKHEQKEDWESAIAAYQEVLDKEDEADEQEVELSLYNRIGDLHLRLGQTDEAVSYYETAADKYAESGFFNNAIALCNKALRHQPDRPRIYLKLSGLCAEQGFQTDARRWILEYADRQMKLGRVEDALTGLENFADLSDDPGVRESLAEQLVAHERGGEAVEQLRHAYRRRTERGEADEAAELVERAREIDPSVDFEAEEVTTEAPATDDSGFEDAIMAPESDEEPLPEPSDEPGEEMAGGGAGLEGLETRPEEEPEVEEDAIGGIEGLEPTAAELEGADEEAGDISGLEVSFSEQEMPATPEDVDADALGGLETFGELEVEEEADELAEEEPGLAEEEPELAEEEPEPLPMLDTGFDEEEDEEDAEEVEPLPMLDMGAGEEPEEEPGEAAGEVPDEAMDLDFGTMGFGDEEEGAGVVAEDLDEAAEEDEEAAEAVDIEAILQRARETVSRGLTGEALRELRLLSTHGQDPEVFEDGLSVVNEIVRHDANDIDALQLRVEFAMRADDRALLLEAYTDLADALARLGAETKAQAMYERVLDLDPENEAAREALGEGGEEDEATIDLDAVLREAEPDEMSRERAAESDPSFAAMLSQFKAKVEQPESDDAGDHYDLGLAFKEMGLIDEAIAEFQSALTGGTERLKVYEELGQCFIQKNQYNVALQVLSRALKVPHSDQTDLLGVYYHMGQCHEELGQRAEAREAYEKVLAIDETFADVPDRVARL